jgi:predicted acyltransferase
MTKAPKIQRVESVDIYRGFVMFLMMAEVWEFGQVAKAFPNSAFWQLLQFQQSHVPWVGCSLHDLIQPSFSFLVGAALPFSLASRQLSGQSTLAIWRHTFRRAFILIALGIFLRSMYSKQTNFTFEDTLTQIGLGYVFLFALGWMSKSSGYWIALGLILMGYWAWFALYPLPGSNFDWSQTGIGPDWPHHLHGFAAHWNKNTNAAWAFDRWFMNLFPRALPFRFNDGGYSTLSFIPTLGTMILGLIAGQWLYSIEGHKQHLRRFVLSGFMLLLAGLLLHFLGICPIVKRIWTPSWVLFSGGWCFLLLALFYYLVELAKGGLWFYLFTILGANSIAAYVLAHTVVGFIDSSFRIHLGAHYDLLLGVGYRTLISGSVILAIQFWVLHWMYRKRIFIKI